MPDVVVTVPKNFTFDAAPGKRGLAAWIAEGDAAGDPYTGEEWHFFIGWTRPQIQPGERVYVVAEGKLRGYAPLRRVEWVDALNRFALVRGGDAVACTLDGAVQGFRGWRYRWWPLERERSFPDWRTP